MAGDDRMSIIEQIYQSKIYEYMGFHQNYELSNKIKEIGEMLEYEGEEKEEIKELLVDAGNCGEEEGFKNGFKLAVLLMAECIK